VVIAIIVLSILQRKYENLFMCAMALVMFNLPSLFERRLSIEILIRLRSSSICSSTPPRFWGRCVRSTCVFRSGTRCFTCSTGSSAPGWGGVDQFDQSPQPQPGVPFVSPYVAIAAFCFSMTVGVLWEFFEYGMDSIVHTDMQKDTVVHAIYTVTLDETKTNKVVAIKDIQRTE
jgi:hypothetical protein